MEPRHLHYLGIPKWFRCIWGASEVEVEEGGLQEEGAMPVRRSCFGIRTWWKPGGWVLLTSPLAGTPLPAPPCPAGGGRDCSCELCLHFSLDQDPCYPRRPCRHVHVHPIWWSCCLRVGAAALDSFCPPCLSLSPSLFIIKITDHPEEVRIWSWPSAPGGKSLCLSSFPSSFHHSPAFPTGSLFGARESWDAAPRQAQLWRLGAPAFIFCFASLAG